MKPPLNGWFFYIYEMKKVIIKTPLGYTEVTGDENGISKIHVLNEELEISTSIPKELKKKKNLILKKIINSAFTYNKTTFYRCFFFYFY